LLEPALAAASTYLPVDRSPVIDGFRAHEWIIDEGYEGILSAGEIEPRPFEVVFETPSAAPIELQVRAAAAALETIIARYRAMLAFGDSI